ncbi:PepSY domain-containing protein [Verticiella sediminum]|uniref:PepSY domain-containing protein n=1 Tax=Verticiella sediminum TaxID=1247510 RepID=A0A556APJ9_9BURK|nr:PepSY domain-containing protein [Verticiella sediminum]TSH94815.1 PepSY domain-containing protein [Verticiella sediminum]
MALRTRLKRLTYLVHRWTGVAGCILMLLWFVSGITMLFVGYPKLTPWERLGALPELPVQGCCAPLQALPIGADSGALVLTSIRGQPYYVASDRYAYDARTGSPAAPVAPEEALAEAASHLPGARLDYAGTVQEDRWTHAGRLDAHRPLHRVTWQGAGRGTLYISSATGQVVLDAPLVQQRWNYVGAWLHWVYPLRTASVDPAWSWIVIALSAMGTLTAVSGVTVGIWRWRFRGRYKSGGHSPYREPWMHWHHWVGLVFGGIVCTWNFSGLMSMNPVGVFSPGDARPDLAAYEGEAPAALPDGLGDPHVVLQALRKDGFAPVELQWRRLDGVPYVLAYDAQAASRLVLGASGRLRVATQFEPVQVEPAARHLFDSPPARTALLGAYDAYYYQRHPEAMNGGTVRGLPALALDFDDAAHTRVYIDLRTGAVAQSLAQPERAGRWLFYFLHSWDVPALLRLGPVRDAILILLSLGGIVVSASGAVIGWRRLRGTFRDKRRA